MFSYKESYQEAGKNILEVNILPAKYCNFDCIFCPIGRSEHQVEPPHHFPGLADDLRGLAQHIDASRADLVFINSRGEAFANADLAAIIASIKQRQVQVRLLSNGYLLGREPYKQLAAGCDEVWAEIKTVTERDFQQVQRPQAGYNLADYIANMVAFRRSYHGHFIFEVTLLRGYNDDPAAIEVLQKMIAKLSPDELRIVQLTDRRFTKKLGLTAQKLAEISNVLR